MHIFHTHAIMSSIICSDMQEFEQSFQFSCPKFLSPVPPNYDLQLTTDYHKVTSRESLTNFQLCIKVILHFFKFAITKIV